MNPAQEFPAPLENRLLAALPRAEYLRLLPHMKLVHLPPGKIPYAVADAVRYATFPPAAMFSSWKDNT